MKILIVLPLFFATILAEAPYSPRGWRPQGQQFTLPSRQVQQQYGAPSNQFGGPSNQNAAPSNTYAGSTNQNPASLNSYSGPSNQFAASSNQFPTSSNQYGAPVNQDLPNRQSARNFADSNFASNQVNINRDYGTPNNQNQERGINNQQQPNLPQNQQRGFNNQQQPNLPQNQFDQNRFQQQNFDNNNPQRNSNFEPQSNNQFGRLTQANQRNQNPELNSPKNDFGASNLDSQNARRPFTNRANVDFVNDNNNRNQQNLSEDDQDDNRQIVSPRENGNIPEEKYDTPVSTPRSISRGRKPERSTVKPSTTTEEPDTDLDQPNNIAVSTAVAGSESTGQYYILQPDGRLQRVVFMTSQEKSDDKNAAYIANIMYETVEPLKGPIYSYGADNQLVQIN